MLATHVYVMLQTYIYVDTAYIFTHSNPRGWKNMSSDRHCTDNETETDGEWQRCRTNAKVWILTHLQQYQQAVSSHGRQLSVTMVS